VIRPTAGALPTRLLTVLALAALLVSAFALSGCGQKAAEQPTQPAAEAPPAEAPAAEAPAEPAPEAKGEKTEDVTKLKIEDIKKGTGATAEKDKLVTVHYTGWLTDGTKFDSSKDRGEPFMFPLGAGQVIPGWDEGVQGMKVGGIRKLIIPPDMGYGDQGAGDTIPPGATLVFEVELLDVQ
jgi:FKBP-type peptidyl-prolyl cis-trans isomerase